MTMAKTAMLFAAVLALSCVWPVQANKYGTVKRQYNYCGASRSAHPFEIPQGIVYKPPAIGPVFRARANILVTRERYYNGTHLVQMMDGVYSTNHSVTAECAWWGERTTVTSNMIVEHATVGTFDDKSFSLNDLRKQSIQVQLAIAKLTAQASSSLKATTGANSNMDKRPNAAVGVLKCDRTDDANHGKRPNATIGSMTMVKASELWCRLPPAEQTTPVHTLSDVSPISRGRGIAPQLRGVPVEPVIFESVLNHTASNDADDLSSKREDALPPMWGEVRRHGEEEDPPLA